MAKDDAPKAEQPELFETKREHGWLEGFRVCKRCLEGSHHCKTAGCNCPLCEH